MVMPNVEIMLRIMISPIHLCHQIIHCYSYTGGGDAPVSEEQVHVKVETVVEGRASGDKGIAAITFANAAANDASRGFVLFKYG